MQFHVLDPCMGVVCPTGKVCKPDEFYEPVCECNTECPNDLRPVCGTDNRSYDNECLLSYTACMKRNDSLTVAYVGQCKYSKSVIKVPLLEW